ncbi:MAG: hypothetical protein K8J31_27590 [Anaerolineae bacterium]|nr:hypothetical protein [Anaerolineae bacterium]
MSNSNLSDVQMQNLLTALTDAMLSGDADIDHLIMEHQVDGGDVRSLIDVIDQLHRSMTPIQPSPRFVRRLHQDLVGMDTGNVLVRVRRLPPRVQIAAGIALVAGVMILSRRRAGSEDRQERQERAAAQ